MTPWITTLLLTGGLMLLLVVVHRIRMHVQPDAELLPSPSCCGGSACPNAGHCTLKPTEEHDHETQRLPRS
jgi:hypothetical protein